MYVFLFLTLIVSYGLCENIEPCFNCKESCALLPPSNGPCYQGTPENAAKCFKTDPLLLDNTTWACGECVSFGYETYLQNDPLYKEMELWVDK